MAECEAAARRAITLDTFVADLAHFIRALDAGPVHLVGHSSPGGFGGLRLAARYPELVRSLVLLEPPAFTLLGVGVPPRPAQLIRLLIRRPRAGLALVRFGARGVGPAARAFDRGDDAQGLRAFLAANTSEAVVAGMPEAVFQRFLDNVGPLKAQLRAGFPPLRAADARAVAVPTLPVSGQRVARTPRGRHRPTGGAAARRGAAGHPRSHPQHVRQPPRCVQRGRPALPSAPLARRTLTEPVTGEPGLPGCATPRRRAFPHPRRGPGHTAVVNQPAAGLSSFGTDVEWPDAEAAALARAAAGRPPSRLDELTEWLAGAQGHYPPLPPARPRCLVAGEPAPGLAELATGVGVGLRHLEVPEEVPSAVAHGRDLADEEVDSGTDLLVVVAAGDGDAGVDAVASLLTGAEPVALLPRGAAAVDTPAWMAYAARLRDLRRAAAELRQDADALLARLRRPLLAAVAGFVLHAAARRTPLVLDGHLAVVAGLLAHDVQPRAARWWQIAADDGPAVGRCVDALDQTPLLQLGPQPESGLAGLTCLTLLRAAAARAGVMSGVTEGTTPG